MTRSEFSLERENTVNRVLVFFAPSQKSVIWDVVCFIEPFLAFFTQEIVRVSNSAPQWVEGHTALVILGSL